MSWWNTDIRIIQFVIFEQFVTPYVAMASFTWVVVALLYMFIDVAYFLRGALVVVVCRMMISFGLWKTKPLDVVKYHGICLTTDMDFQWHMNNSRYLRECDFGRVEMWTLTGIYDVVQKLGGGITMGASTIRYRKSLQLFDTYTIDSKILCWDDKAFYVEQQIVRKADKFVCAIVLVRQSLMRLSPSAVLQELTGQEIASPDIPPEVESWIEYNQRSSEKLKKSA